MSQITKHMKQTGLHVDEEGMCYGIAMMAIQAFLLGAEQYQHYLKRLETIMKNPVEPGINWGDDVDHVDIHAYFQGIALYQSPNKYPQLFSPAKRDINQLNTNETSTVAQSKLAEEWEGILNIGSFIGLYNSDKELEFYLTSYQQAVAVKEITQEKGRKKLRCALLLSSYNHAIMLAYDVDKHCWHLQNHDARYEHTDIQSVIKQIKEAYRVSFSTNNTHILATTIFSLGNAQKATFLVYKSWSTHEHWKQIHKTTAEKAKLEDKSGGLLYLAAKHGCLGQVKELLAAGAPVDAVTSRGSTPLHIAVQNGHTEIVKILINAEADVRMTAGGFTPLHIAAQKGHTETVELLLRAGADVNAKMADGGSSLYVAAESGHAETVEVLLREGADANAATTDGFTPLHVAAQNGHTNIIKLLLKVNANVNAVTVYGSTPISIATQNDHTDIVELLNKVITYEYAKNKIASILYYPVTLFWIVAAPFQQGAKQLSSTDEERPRTCLAR